MDDTATTTTIARTSNSNSNTMVGSDSSLPRYRPDYSRSQHPLIPSTRPSSSPSPQPFPSTMSPEQIRFEKYVNRFAVHDPRSSPIKRQKDATDPSQQQQRQEGGVHSPPEMLSVSERINRFNKGGGQPQHQQLPIPQQQQQHQHLHHLSGTPPRNAYTPSKILQRSESLDSSSDGDHIHRVSSGNDSVVVAEAGPVRASVSNQRQGHTAHEPLRAKSSSSTSSYNPSTPQTPKLTVSTSTVTTATNITASTSASGGLETIPDLEQREAPSTPPPSRFNPSRSVRPLMSEGPRSYSYDQPRLSSTTAAIETQSPARVAELRKKLWDTNETLQVAVPPSLHYIGGRRDASELSLASEQQRASRSATKAVLPKGGPEMAGRYGQRSRSHSPKRPQYASSTFKSRYYEAALASRRAAVQSSPLSKHVYQPKMDPDRVELERQFCDAPEHKPDPEARSIHNDNSNKHDELSKQDYGPQRGRQPQDYGPRKAHNLDYRDTESQRTQEHLQSLMVNATGMAQQQQQQSQLSHQSVGTPNKGDGAVSNMWRRQPMPSLVDERSDTTGEASVAKLVAKLNSISRDNPAEALAQIDSILRAESKSSSGDMDQARLQTPVKSAQEEKKDEYERLDDEDSDSDDDDETSMSSITNPSYAHAMLGPQNLPPLLTSGRSLRPNALQTYQQQLPSATEGQEDVSVRTKNKQRHTPPATIQVKESSGNRVVDHFMGRLDQLLTNENSSESRNAAAIAMKIRMWDEMSISKSPSKLDEALSMVPSLQEEIISATTDELGSIVTPADAAANGSVASSQRESPLLMSFLATPPSSLLMPAGSTDNSNQGSRPDVLLSGLDVLQIDLGDTQDELFERGRQRSREESPPPRQLSMKPLTPRRNHPWDHHHPRNRSESREPKPSYEETSMKDGEGLELRPIDPAPVTSPRHVLSVPREAVPNGVKRSPPRGHEQSIPARKDVSKARRESDGQSFVTAVAQVRGDSKEQPEIASSSEFNNQSKLNSKKVSSKQRESKTPTNEVIGSAQKARGNGGVGENTTVQPVDASGGGTGRNTSVFKGTVFEVDPKLLKENDEFGFPIRIKQDVSQITPFLDNFDPAWEPLTASTFFPTKKDKSSVAQQPQQDTTLLKNNGVNTMPNKVPGGGQTRPKSPGRSRFNILRMKKGQDSDLHSPSFDNPNVVDATRQNRFSGRTSPEKHRDDSINRSSEKSKFSILKLKKSRDESLNKFDQPSAHVDSTVLLQTQKRPISKSPKPRATGSPMPSRASPSRERSGSFNIVQRFNRLMREKESEA